MKKLENISIGVFFISIFLIGIILFSSINEKIIIKLEDNTEIIGNSPFGLTQVLALMFLTFLATISIFYYLRETLSKKNLTDRQKISLNALEGDEKQVYEYLLKKEEAMQKDLVYELKFSKAKVSRILDKLESKNLIKRYSYGFSNKIKLN
jgi:uncharacterized membrane protein